MRVTIGVLALAMSACNAEGPPEDQAAQGAPAAPVEVVAAAKAAPAQSSPLMAIPEDPQALQRLEAMGYTIHEDHLHAPGVIDCPKMGDGPVM